MDGADYSQRVLLLDPSKVWFAAPRHSGSQVSAQWPALHNRERA